MVHLARRLPWFVALVAFVLFAGTLGGGVTLNSLPLAAKIAGWDELPLVGQPLVWLLTLPLHLLPAAWVPLGLKLLAAAMAALILALLTRTVQMLPWDHPWEMAGRHAFLLPVLTAAAACGLEFGFWQEATSSLMELVDLLMLAAAGWLLLEYNVRQEPRWLDAAAVVWGLGMAENWLMLLTLPLFVAGLIWVQRLRFFQWKFILRMAALGLAGFSVYAVLPLANGLAPHSPWNLGEAWIASLRQTKNVLLLLYYQFWRGHRLLTMALLIYYLVPTLPLLVRMRDEGMANKFGVDRLQLWLYRGLRVVLLLACVWLALEPTVGPQPTVQRQLGLWVPMLSFDYLNALGLAFLAGNLLLISQIPVRDDYYGPRSRIPWRQLAIPLAAGGLVLVIIGWTIRSAPAVVRLNFHPLEQFGAQAVKSLPAGRGVVLSDFPQKLAVFEAALAHRPDAANWLAVDTHALPTVEYRAQLERRLPAGWLTAANRHELTPLETARLLVQVARTNRLFYLHPSYGLFFEAFYLEPAGVLYEMKGRGKNPLAVPPLSTAATDANEKFWTGLWTAELGRLVPPPSRPAGGVGKQMVRLGLTAVPSRQDRQLAEWYSMALDGWAVTLQTQGRLAEARRRFEQALELNPNNLSARISLACNTNLQAGTPMGLADVAKVSDQLGNPDRVNLLLNSGGPFDEPTVGYLLGSVFLQRGLLLQAAEQFERVRTLTPGSLAPELALAEIYNRLQMTDRSRPLITRLREEARKLPANSSLDLNLALLDSYSWLMQTNVSNARTALTTVVEQHPDDPQVKNRVLNAYLAMGDVTNALRLVESQLALTPDDVASLNGKAIILIQAGRAAEAIPVLNQVLTLTNLPAARMNRAFAQIGQKNFAAAESDFRELETNGIAPGMVGFGLAIIAEQRHDTNQAMRYFQLCLTNTPAGTPLWRQASARLQTLETATAR